MDNSRNEKTGIRKRNREHVCPTVLIRRKKEDDQGQQMVKTVHEDRVAKGGDLHKSVTGKRAPWEIVFRNRQKIEGVIEKKKSRKKKNEKTLIAPSGEILVAPTKGS